MGTNVSEELAASMLTLNVFLYPEDGGNMFLRNVALLYPEETDVLGRENLKSPKKKIFCTFKC
jgi:hypothetical protein